MKESKLTTYFNITKIWSSDTVDLGLSHLWINIDYFHNSSNVLVFVIETPCVFCDVGIYNI